MKRLACGARLGSLVLSLWMSLQVVGRAQGPDQRLQEEYVEVVKRIDKLSRGKDLDGLVSAAEDIERVWGPRGGDFYYSLVRIVSQPLGSNPNGSDPHILGLQKHARLALDNKSPRPAWVEVHLAGYLQRNLEFERGQVVDDAWADMRRAKAQYWLRAWERLTRELQLSFNSNDRPLGIVPPPPGSAVAPWARPEKIKDPALRKQYEEAIAKNQEKARIYDEQSRLHELAKSFPQMAEQYLLNGYRTQPLRVAEFKEDIARYAIPADAKKRLIRAVEDHETAYAKHQAIVKEAAEAQAAREAAARPQPAVASAPATKPAAPEEPFLLRWWKPALAGGMFLALIAWLLYIRR